MSKKVISHLEQLLEHAGAAEEAAGAAYDTHHAGQPGRAAAIGEDAYAAYLVQELDSGQD